MAGKILIELFSSSFCQRCINIKKHIESIIIELGKNRFDYQEIDVVEEIDYAVSMKVKSTPSIAINGKLIFSSVPTLNDLKDAIEQIEEK